ncbi:hypothetical protein ACT2CR_00445 [Candidatus Vidania fulgoroideorum]
MKLKQPKSFFSIVKKRNTKKIILVKIINNNTKRVIFKNKKIRYLNID